MKTYDYILLDWDGNLAKTLDVWLEATRAPFDNRGIPVTDAEVVSCFGVPWERYEELGITDLDTAISEMDEVAVKLLPDVELYPDALFVLEKLKKAGKKTALITSSRRKNVIHALDKYDVHRFFDLVITNEDTVKHKPDAEPLETALAQLGGKPSRAVMIGDGDKDIGAAKNAGVDSILFFPKAHEKFYDIETLKAMQPTFVVEDFREILDIV